MKWFEDALGDCRCQLDGRERAISLLLQGYGSEVASEPASERTLARNNSAWSKSNRPKPS